MKEKRILFFCVLLASLIGRIASAQTSAEWEPKGGVGAAVSAVGLTACNPEMAVVGYENGDVFMTLTDGTSQQPSWMKIDEPAQGPALPDGKLITSIAVSPTDSRTFFVAFAGCKYYGNLWVTRNGGRSFSEVETGPYCNLTNVSINPVDPSIVYVTDNVGEVYTSEDFGATWTTDEIDDPLTPPNATGRISAVSSAQNSREKVIVGTTTGEVWMTFNAGAGAPSWTLITNESNMYSPDFPEATVSGVMYDDLFSPPMFFVAFNQPFTGDSLWKNSRGGAPWSWSNIQGGAINQYAAVGSVSINPAFSSTAYATTTYTEYDAYKSDAMGYNWFDAGTSIDVCGIPPYAPDFWNDGSTVQSRNNCYNYANNHRTDTFAQPGKAAGEQYSSLTCEDVHRAAEADGLVPLTGGDCPLSKTKVALVVAPGWDYHWYRLDSNNMWSHKPGRTRATDKDNDLNVITSPETADRGRYTDFCGYMCLCSDEEQGQGHENIE